MLTFKATEIIASQKLDVAWEEVETKQHKLLKVETLNDKVDELFVTGKRTARLTNGQETVKEFRSHIIIKNLDVGPRMSLCKS
jgi:hypothetical protein